MGQSCSSSESKKYKDDGGVVQDLSSKNVGFHFPSNKESESPIHTGSVLGLSSSFNGKTLSCGDDKRIAIFSWTKNNSPLRQQPSFSIAHTSIMYCTGHEKAVNRIAVADGFIWSASRDLSLRQWKLETGECVQIMQNAHELNLSSVAIRSGDSKVFSGSRDYTVKGWDIETLLPRLKKKNL